MRNDDLMLALLAVLLCVFPGCNFVTIAEVSHVQEGQKQEDLAEQTPTADTPECMVWLAMRHVTL